MNATTFYNVTITIETDDPKDAYNKLCDALADIALDWNTTTYAHGSIDDELEHRDTMELFPDHNHPEE